ncbi:Oxoglutarate/iron-dependent dioxygenase [Corchorus capsularis]|uniref:Oxoglutarate/iron-dependent dioxygenase n=1 Tax=Corchorus capsularis TaxID=210143 RepID=A0A1R3IH33_COCAP|nr:Oxoglutarate/iron-dependent dioxygenase [Corchorus capsularis]
MSPPAMAMTDDFDARDQTEMFQKGVKHLFENGVNKLPKKYILPVSDRPNVDKHHPNVANSNLKLPIIDFAELQGPNRSQILNSLSSACQEYGFFQVVNHGIPIEVIKNMIDVSGRFFGMPYEERAKYMTADMSSPVRYGTSFNQTKDSVFSWRDFLKLICNPLPEVLPRWPSSPVDFRELAADYAKETKNLFLRITEAILESLGIFSNGRYKSVLHRVLVNPAKPRLSVATLHSLPFDRMVGPSPKLIDEANPRRYMDTDFATFLEYISSREPKKKNFLESRKLT